MCIFKPVPPTAKGTASSVTETNFATLNVKAKSALRIQFFEFLFQDNEGWLCIATTHPEFPKPSFTQKFFQWPTELAKVEEYILSVENKLNVYYGVNLLSHQERTKERCLPTDLLWADFDETDPDGEKVTASGLLPPLVVESSPKRYQAFWRLTSRIEPFEAEMYSRRIAYAFDTDKSGWDLTQLFRVPYTHNFKYRGAPTITVNRMLTTRAPAALFETLAAPPKEAGEEDFSDYPMPEVGNAESIVYKYTKQLAQGIFSAVYSQQPAEGDDWSKTLWKLIHICFEAGMEPEEVFTVVHGAECNKYKRDGRPIHHLWRDVLRASASHAKFATITGNFKPLEMPKLVEEPASESFVTEYRTWAEEATDAVPHFHDLCAFILLSSIVANSVRLDTSYGHIVPNLWGLILGDSTLTRKTTAMRMVTDLLIQMDSSMIVATEGSAEGLLSAISARPHRTSIFFKDEVSGFFDAISKKEYMAGMVEHMTALYDVPAIYNRQLRRESFKIESPAFIFFGGGVKDRVYEALSDRLVISGFLPRFLVVAGDTDLTRLRRTGPASNAGLAKRDSIVQKIADLYETYATDVITNIGGQQVSMPRRIVVHLTDEAWDRYGAIEETMVLAASSSPIPDLALPTFERLSRSLLKMSIILACTRQHPDAQNRVKVEESDVVNAAWYVQQWGQYSIDLIIGAGKKVSERLMEKILKAIEMNPGVLRSQLMQSYHLTKREADEIFSTLEERQKIRRESIGKSNKYFPTY